TAHMGGRRIAAADRTAADSGAVPGLPLADARALLPSLYTAEADPAGDRQALDGLAEWCGRYTPWTAMDESGDGIWLDVSGCAHLFDGERSLLRDLTARLAGFGFAAVAAVASTPGAAWAVARFAAVDAHGIAVVPVDGTARALAPLPVAGLRLPAATVEGLARMGLRRIGQLAGLPRAPLVRRFGDAVVARLDRALGRVREPLSPRRPAAPFSARIVFAEPVAGPEVITRAARRLLDAVCAQLAKAHRGARRLQLVLYRTDGTLARAAVGTSRPVRDADHLERLFREKLNALDAGFGVEAMALGVVEAAPLPPVQMADAAAPHQGDDSVAKLLDRLGNRLGADCVVGLEPVASHIPERACREIPPAARKSFEISPGAAHAAAHTAGRPPARPRPLQLLAWPEPIEAVAPVPDHPPVMFRWRRRQHRVARADGPERICPEWWRETGELAPGDRRLRDYYRIEDADGGRFWVFREGTYRAGEHPRWYLHGFFP
ncbi:MAG TPA: DNA polymerase Y family protein, partial [Rhodospirillales bacterium]